MTEGRDTPFGTDIIATVPPSRPRRRREKRSHVAEIALLDSRGKKSLNQQIISSRRRSANGFSRFNGSLPRRRAFVPYPSFRSFSRRDLLYSIPIRVRAKRDLHHCVELTRSGERALVRSSVADEILLGNESILYFLFSFFFFLTDCFTIDTMELYIR